jgi:hypothetical protein
MNVRPSLFSELRRRNVLRATVLYAPFLGAYQGDPRFAAFCRKVGLPTTPDAKVMP